MTTGDKRMSQVSLNAELNRISGTARQVVIATIVIITSISSFLIGSLTLMESGTLQARVLAEGASAPLAFNDVQTAAEMLQSLGRLTGIEQATIRSKQNQVFASYHRQDSTGVENSSGLWTLLPVVMRQVEIAEPVQFNNQTIGTVHVNLSLSSLYWQTLWFLLAAALAALSAFWISRRLVNRLNSSVLAPLVALERVMRTVARTAVNGQRAILGRIVEVNSLALSFNTMLEQLEQRDAKLQAHRSELEQQIASRTADLSRAKDAAEAANRSKSDFLATMSHEIRTPLIGVLGMNELLLSTKLSNEQRAWASDMQSSGQQLMRVINDVLDFSKIEAGRMELELVDFDLLDLTEDCLVVFTSAAQEKNLELVAEFYPDSAPLMLRGDPFRLRQVITNLLSNAIKFTHEGGVVVRLHRDDTSNGVVSFRICVEDSGIGISKQGCERIFEEFSQVDSSTTREFGGTGLGLTICRRLLTLMGGTIHVESEPGKGTRFWVNIGLQVSPRQPLLTQSVDQLAGKRVLLALARPRAKAVLLRLYESWRMQVSCPATVKEAADWARAASVRNQPFDLVVLETKHSFKNSGQDIDMDDALSGLTGQRILMISGPGASKPVATHTNTVTLVEQPIRRATMRRAVQAVLQIDQTSAAGCQQAANPTMAMHPGSVLLVEDNLINQRLAAAMLTRLGVKVIMAANGLQALEQFERQGADLVLMDCQMPVMDGYQATAELRQRTEMRDRRLPIIALTANAMREDEQRCLDAGMDDFLPKPFTQEELRHMLSRWLPQESEMNHQQVTPDASAGTRQRDSVINPKQIEFIRQLDTNGESGLLREMLTYFVASAQEGLRDIENAMAIGDCQMIVRITHKLKSGADNVGAEQLAGLFRQFEAFARESRTAEMAARLPFLRQAQEQATGCIQAILQESQAC